MNPLKKSAGIGILLCLFASCDQQNIPLDPATPSGAVAVAEPVANTDEHRVVIRTAELKLSVGHLPEKVNEIRNLAGLLHGKVYHYDVKSNRQFRQETAFALDSAYHVYDVHPEAFVKIKIPVADADSFIQAVLNMDATIDQLTLDDEDITEDLLAKKELIAPVIPDSDKPKKLTEQQYRDERAETMIARKADFNKLNYRSAFLWFDIHLNGEPYVEKHPVFTSHELRSPFFLEAYTALREGAYHVESLLLVLLNIWPYLLIVTILIIAHKKRWIRLFPSRLRQHA